MSGSGVGRELNRTQKVEAIYKNGLILWDRMGTLEARSVGVNRRLERVERFVASQGFWSRLRWLFTGK